MADDDEELVALALRRALQAFRQEWSCEAIAVSYITPLGLVTLTVDKDRARLSDEHGNVQILQELKP